MINYMENINTAIPTEFNEAKGYLVEKKIHYLRMMFSEKRQNKNQVSETNIQYVIGQCQRSRGLYTVW